MKVQLRPCFSKRAPALIDLPPTNTQNQFSFASLRRKSVSFSRADNSKAIGFRSYRGSLAA